jgi:hypothetical protein
MNPVELTEEEWEHVFSFAMYWLATSGIKNTKMAETALKVMKGKDDAGTD